jgi:hypothetical protein
MALRALQGPAGGAAPVGGSGTLNTIPRWTGATTLGDSGITDNGSTVSFVGRNLASTAAQTWTLNTSLSLLSGVVGFYNSGTDGTYGDAIYIGAATYPTSYRHLIRSSVSAISTNSLLKFSLSTGASTQADVMTLRGDGSVGIGTASPNAILSVYNASTPTISLWNSSNFTRFSTNTNDCFIDVGLGGTAGALIFRRSSSATESARIDSSGNFAVGRATTAGTIFETQGDTVTFRDAAGNVRFRFEAANSLLNIGIGTGWGLKLPATPLNTDPNTLDSYREGTRVLAAGDLSGWTYVTATQYWTLVGRTVTLHTIFTGGTSSATGGATIATPPLLTPLRIAAGAAVNSSGTALGNGVCVVAPTSSTTGTVITSNAISSSSVDKVITVTYETAGL